MHEIEFRKTISLIFVTLANSSGPYSQNINVEFKPDSVIVETIDIAANVVDFNFYIISSNLVNDFTLGYVINSQVINNSKLELLINGIVNGNFDFYIKDINNVGSVNIFQVAMTLTFIKYYPLNKNLLK